MGWIGVDLDGTLSHDSHKKSIIPGPPIPQMVDRVKAAIEAGKDVRIFTARIAGGFGNFDPLDAKARIFDWCKLYLGQLLPVTCKKDQHMEELWDDKARGVQRNSGEFLDVRFGVGLDWDPPQNRIVPADEGPIVVDLRDPNLTPQEMSGRVIEGVAALTERVQRRYPDSSFRGKA